MSAIPDDLSGISPADLQAIAAIIRLAKRSTPAPEAPAPVAPALSPTSEATTVADVLDWHTKNVSPDVCEEARKEVARILRMFKTRFGATPVSAMRAADLVDFVRSQSKVRKAATINRWYRTLKQPFHQAEEMGLIVRSPFKSIRLPRGDHGRDLTLDEFRTMLRFTPPAMRRALVFLRFTGCRPGELKRLKWEHIDWQARVAILREHKTSRTQRTPKPRRIYLCSLVIKLLLWLKRNSVSAYVFVNSYGGQWKTRAMCKNISCIRARALLPADAKLYGTRHLAATSLVMSGADLATVAELLGHTTTQCTQYYVHLAGQTAHLHEAVERAARRDVTAPEAGEREE